MDELLVRLQGRAAARLSRRGPTDYVLVYEEQWLAAADAMPLSASLPLAPGTHRGRTLHDFVDNLLPDDPAVRQRWAQQAGLTTTEPFDLLTAYGQDVAGALEFVTLPEHDRPSGLTALDDRAVGARIAAVRADPTAWTDPGGEVGRFSLGGAQAKFALAAQQDRWFEPSGSTPGTHIFKKGVERLDESEVIEYLVMRAARALGLPTASVQLRRFDGQRALVVERFDRVALPDERVVRLHQEDLLQALGRPRLRKYETHGGPGYRDVLAALGTASATNAASSREVFARALAFSWLVLDTDAHAKNFALMTFPDTRLLAPLYDRSSLLPYLRGGSRRQLTEGIAKTTLSMSVLGSYRVGDVRAESWRTVARDARIDPDALVDWVRQACDALADVVQQEIRGLDEQDRSAVVDLLNRRIRVRTEAASRALR